MEDEEDDSGGIYGVWVCESRARVAARIDSSRVAGHTAVGTHHSP